MKKINLLLIFIFSSSFLFAQYSNDVSRTLPYGQAHPEAPKEIKDYQALIGKCNCKSTSRKQDGTWNTAIDMTWEWRYIMNGKALQDMTLKEDGAHSGSIRQFNTETKKWMVHYYASNSVPETLPAWKGSKIEDGTIVHYRERKAPNGTEGYFRLTFYDINEEGYKWVGEWVDKTEKIIYPTWKIECKRDNKK